MDKRAIKQSYTSLLDEIRKAQQDIELARAKIKIIQLECAHAGHVYPAGGYVCKFCGYDND